VTDEYDLYKPLFKVIDRYLTTVAANTPICCFGLLHVERVFPEVLWCFRVILHYYFICGADFSWTAGLASTFKNNILSYFH